MPADKLLSGIAASACCGHIVIIAVFQYAGIPCFFRDNRIFHGKIPLLYLYRASQSTAVPSELSFFQIYTLYQDWTGKTIHICACHPGRMPSPPARHTAGGMKKHESAIFCISCFALHRSYFFLLSVILTAGERVHVRRPLASSSLRAFLLIFSRFTNRVILYHPF